MLVIVGASGKLGCATLNALLDHNLIPPQEIICTTSSEGGAQKLEQAKGRGVQIKSAQWDDSQSFVDAFQGCTKLLLISSSRISKEFGDEHVAPGKGREEDHFIALEAAKKAGVQHVYYTSLAFAKPSRSRVMIAHVRTEDWLHANAGDMKYTIIREGLYNESWPLYFGHYNLKGDSRSAIALPGDGKISWTSIADLGLANALILAAPSEEWAGKLCYLSQNEPHTLKEVATMVSKGRGEVDVNIVSTQEHIRENVEREVGRGLVTWWSPTYDALRDGECEIDDGTLKRLLKERGVTPTPMKDTVDVMLREAL